MTSEKSSDLNSQLNPQLNPQVNSRLTTHEPVMLNEIAQCFTTVPPGVVVDATFGLGGHAKAILKANPSIQILGLDQDADAIANAERMIADDASLRGRLTVRQVRFDSLNMRMDQRSELSAADVVNNYQESELAGIITQNADERFARRIARAIVVARPISTTTHLAEVIVAAIPAPARRTGGHPAKRTFQAIRIEVNKELEILARTLQIAIDATKVGGRVAVLTYHSGENRIVKQVFRSSEKDADEIKIGSPYVHESQLGTRRVSRVRIAQYPSEQEQTQNRRAKSARLRVIEKDLVEARG